MSQQTVIVTGASRGIGAATARLLGREKASVVVNYAGVPPTTYGPTTSAPTNAGSYRARAIFSGDQNHTGSQDATDFTIARVASTTTVTAATAVPASGRPCT